MFGRSWLFGAMIVGTAALPYVMSTSSGVRQWITDKIPARGASEPAVDRIAATTTTLPDTRPGATPGAVTKTRAARPEDVPTHSLEEALQFNVTTSWIVAEWPRVSADLAELDLYGYRVPLVSGTKDSDVAGSLTYYFDPKQQVARITFFGSTGDPRQLLTLLETRFSFKRMATTEPNLYLYQVTSWGKASSELRIRPAKIIRSDSPHSRFEVALLIERPKSAK